VQEIIWIRLNEYETEIFLVATPPLKPQSLVIAKKLRHVLRAIHQAIEKLLMKLASGGGELVIAPFALFACEHKARLAEIGQVSGCFGLRNVQHFDDVAHTQFPTPEHVENAQPGTIREGPEHSVNAMADSGFHIRLGKYIGRD
jgi:hypothetical protein